MARLSRSDARETLSRARCPLGVDFHALRTEQVDALLGEADARRYRKPRNANGSRARYFHAYLVRAANSADD